MLNKAAYDLYNYHLEMIYSMDTLYELTINQWSIDTGKRTPFTDKVYWQLKEYFDGTRKEFDIPYELVGTEFQKKVWKELLKIPYGETISYKELAIRIGNERAQRAVGGANNKNKLAIIVPCHRVIGSNGSLVGYASGVDVKKMLLELEKSHL